MLETSKQSAPPDAGAKPENGYSQYQHQTLTLDNTLGLLCVSILAFVLLLGLLRQQARYQKLVAQLSQPQ